MQLLLSPKIANIATPTTWIANTAHGLAIDQYADQIHCFGGGSLLLWLLLRAQHARSHRSVKSVGTSHLPPVVFHGDLLLPTPMSAAAAQQSADEDVSQVSIASRIERTWRRQAVLAGLDGSLHHPRNAWARPIFSDVAAGRFQDLETDMLKYIEFWDRVGNVEWCSADDKEDGAGGHALGFSELADNHPLLIGLTPPMATA